jgi:hypothetical protein
MSVKAEFFLYTRIEKFTILLNQVEICIWYHTELREFSVEVDVVEEISSIERKEPHCWISWKCFDEITASLLITRVPLICDFLYKLRLDKAQEMPQKSLTVLQKIVKLLESNNLTE